MTERLLKNGTLTDRDIMQAEVLVKIECPEMKACIKALNEVIIKRDRERRAKDDPTTQE